MIEKGIIFQVPARVSPRARLFCSLSQDVVSDTTASAGQVNQRYHLPAPPPSSWWFEPSFFVKVDQLQIFGSKSGENTV